MWWFGRRLTSPLLLVLVQDRMKLSDRTGSADHRTLFSASRFSVLPSAPPPSPPPPAPSVFPAAPSSSAWCQVREYMYVGVTVRTAR